MDKRLRNWRFTSWRYAPRSQVSNGDEIPSIRIAEPLPTEAVFALNEPEPSKTVLQKLVQLKEEVVSQQPRPTTSLASNPQVSLIGEEEERKGEAEWPLTRFARNEMVYAQLVRSTLRKYPVLCEYSAMTDASNRDNPDYPKHSSYVVEKDQCVIVTKTSIDTVLAGPYWVKSIIINNNDNNNTCDVPPSYALIKTPVGGFKHSSTTIESAAPALEPRVAVFREDDLVKAGDLSEPLRRTLAVRGHLWCSDRPTASYSTLCRASEDEDVQRYLAGLLLADEERPATSRGNGKRKRGKNTHMAGNRTGHTGEGCSVI